MWDTIKHRMKRIRKSQRGSVLIMTLSTIAFLLILLIPIITFSISGIRLIHIRNASQTALDEYTVKIGKEIMKSIKNGHDYSSDLKTEVFKSDLQKQLDITKRYSGHDSDNKIVYEIKDIKVEYIYDKTLKTKLSYTIQYHVYFMSKPFSMTDFKVTQESLYNLKY